MNDLNTAGFRGGVSWTASDTNDIPETINPRAIWVGTEGDLTIRFRSGSVTFSNVPVGVFPVNGFDGIDATGTTASSLVVGW